MTDAPITLLPWDTSHFGVRIARANTMRLTADTCRRLESACRNDAIDCLYFLADAADLETIAVLQDSRFNFVDIRLSLSGRASDISEGHGSSAALYRLGHDGDLAPLLPIAASSYAQSRFYSDRRFGRDKAARMYQLWLRNSLTTDFADAVIVAEMDEAPVGYVTCHLNKPLGEASIGLVGLAESARGEGLASGMLRYLGSWLAERGFDRCHVVTQGRNLAAQRLYQRCGFVSSAVELWFHKWFN